MARTLAVVAGIAATAAAFALFTRLQSPWVALCWCGLVPWLAVLERTTTFGGALATAWALSSATTIAVYAWFGLAIAGYTGLPAAIVLLGLIALGPVIEPQFLLFAAARHLVRRSGAGPARTALTGACVYVASEWLIPKLFADTMGHALYGSALWRQAADLAGVPGLTFVLVLGNEWVWATLRAAAEPPPRRARAAALPALGVVLLIAALSAYGMWAYRVYGSPAPGATAVRAGIVQGNISHYEEMAREIGTYDAVRMILDTYFTMSAQLLEQTEGRLDLLVWPETVYPTTFGTPKSTDGAAFDREITAFVDRARRPAGVRLLRSRRCATSSTPPCSSSRARDGQPSAHDLPQGDAVSASPNACRRCSSGRRCGAGCRGWAPGSRATARASCRCGWPTAASSASRR